MKFPVLEVWFVVNAQGEVLIGYLSQNEALSFADGHRRLRGPMPVDRVHVVRRKYVDAKQAPLRR